MADFTDYRLVLLETMKSTLKKLDATTIQKWAKNPDKLREALEECLMLKSDFLDDYYTTYINYERSVEDLIQKGAFDIVDPAISSTNFPNLKSGQQKVTIRILEYKKPTKNFHVIKEMQRMKVQPATLVEMLTFLEQYPYLKNDIPLIALGSVWIPKSQDRTAYFPYCWDSPILKKHILNLYNAPNFLFHFWNTPIRFAVLAKE